MFNWVFKTVVGRWVTGILVALLLGGAALKWHNFKEGLIHKGQQVCVQEINKETVQQLQDALAAEKVARAELSAQLTAIATENQASRDRRVELEKQLSAAQRAMAEQRKNDETYKAWADAPLPAGVGERLRDQAAAGHSGAVRDDRN
ncbi:MAG: hypothetical protein E4H01_10690 [Lysobacterales bacterium]|nr:MAG: hypothetical protein E4H01_10690 [Xanthomonadales bacterium]